MLSGNVRFALLFSAMAFRIVEIGTYLVFYLLSSSHGCQTAVYHKATLSWYLQHFGFPPTRQRTLGCHHSRLSHFPPFSPP